MIIVEINAAVKWVDWVRILQKLTEIMTLNNYQKLLKINVDKN